jgi:hypothetical protein
LAREAGDGRNVVRITHSLADLELSAGNLEQAQDLFRFALESSRDTTYQAVAAHCLLGLATVASARGDVEKAGRLWSAGERLADRLGMRVDPSSQALYDHVLGRLDTHAEKQFSSARNAAGALTIDEALAAIDV